MTIGTIHGVGLGPGAADLMSVRADRLVRGARHVAYFRKSGRRGHARTIVDGMLRDDVVEYPMDYPVTTEIVFTDPRYNECLAAFYATCTAHILSLVQGGEDVVVLCEGDPFFYGSFMHLHSRLKDHAPVAVVPGITGMSGAWTASGAPITWGDDVLTVAMATLPEAELTIGRHLPKLRRAIAAAGREGQAWLVEHAAQAAERVRPLVEVEDAPAPYFSIALIHGQGRRP
jgi:precorrin-2/cobalt-factor-2 C20-methyltransferase